MKLAELEGTRSIFKCGTYKIPRALLETVRSCTETLDAEQAPQGGASGFLGCHQANVEPSKVCER